MPKLNIEKSTLINAPINDIYETLSNFHKWQAWSPWLLMEVNADVNVDEDGKHYRWEGNRVGAGNMTVLSESDEGSAKVIKYALNFLKPWKSYADVSFVLSPTENGTKVSWTMDSSLPFFLFWMKKPTEAFVGMDYQRGLNMLKEQIEDGSIKSSLSFVGETNFPETSYVGIKTTCDVEDISTCMARDFTKLKDFLKEAEDNSVGHGLSIYHKWDIVKGKAEYTAAIAVSKTPSNLPNDIVYSTIPHTSVYQITHTGDYKHLGNAWTTLYTMERNKEIKCNKAMHPFEIYENSPDEVSAGSLITHVCFPTK